MKGYTRSDVERSRNEFFSLDEHIGWLENKVLTQLLIRRQGDGWQLIIKATGSGKPLVAFMGFRSLSDMPLTLSKTLEAGLLRWYPDKYPPRSK